MNEKKLLIHTHKDKSQDNVATYEGIHTDQCLPRNGGSETIRGGITRKLCGGDSFMC